MQRSLSNVYPTCEVEHTFPSFKCEILPKTAVGKEFGEMSIFTVETPDKQPWLGDKH